MTQLDRIAAMEQALNNCTAALDAMEAALPQLRMLAEYLSSGQWREDYEADEAGLIPPDVRRGVLSQDALYDLLARYDLLQQNLKEDRL
ncbi:MAG: DUF4298 domain-containing protein [Clostridia bacterium]|nr:DUF4298 domain-containing protein [Clostridia bacterium]